MKPIIRKMCMALLATPFALSAMLGASEKINEHINQDVVQEEIVLPTPAKDTNLQLCDLSKEVLTSPEVESLSLDAVELGVINDKLCSYSLEQKEESQVIHEEEPSLIIEPNRIYTGQAAIEVVRQREGELTSEMEHIIIEEGYVLGDYHDVGETYASGVGQTGEFKGMSFKQSFNIHRERAINMFPKLDTYSEELRKNIISSVYRGGITGSPKTRALIVKGCYELAADEFLNNDEYRKATKSNSGVAKRMERLAEALRTEPVSREAKCGSL